MTKVMLLLKFAGLEFSEDRGGKVEKTLKLQGFGRHTPAEQDELAIRVDAPAAIIGETAFLMDDRPCGADATVFSFVAQLLTPVFVTPTRTAAEKHQNLVSYRDRIQRQYFSQ